MTIGKAALTVTTPSAGKVYDGTALTAAGSFEGLVNGETVGFTTTGAQTGVGRSANTYRLVFQAPDNRYTAKAGNYEISEALGILTVTARSLGSGAAYAEGISVADIPDVDYSHAAHCPEPAVTDDGLASGTGAVLEQGRDFTYSHYEKNLSAGTASVTITGTGNYTKTFTINHLTLTQSDVDGGDASLIDVTSPEEGRRVSAEIRNGLEIINACLTDGKKWRIRNTPDRVQLRLTISRMEEGEVVPAEKELVERYLDSNQGTVLGTYLDIKLDRS